MDIQCRTSVRALFLTGLYGIAAIGCELACAKSTDLGGSGSAGDGLAWASVEPYRAPDFDHYFPDDPDGAQALAVWWAREGDAAVGDEDSLVRVRQGLRRYPRSPQPILRWVGNTYIWGKSPQHPKAIELMYHAATCNGANEDRYGTRGPAIYFGLAVVRPKSPAILRAMVDIAMKVDDADDLSRIAWGVAKQRTEALSMLAPYEASMDAAIREKAAVVRSIFSRELKAHAWAMKKRREEVRQRWREELPSLVAALHTGSSATRRDVLALIAREGIVLIMDDSHLAAFTQCAGDSDAEVRRQTAQIMGERWIGATGHPPEEATDLALYLALDETPSVRFAAVYYGLSAIVDKDERVLRRLVELALVEQESDTYKRILWSLKHERPRVAKLLRDYAGQPSKASSVSTLERDLKAGTE